jgi:N-methylhydantoinase B
MTGKDFVYVEALGGGMGARSDKDGIDGIQVHITNTSNLPIEALELEYPLRVQYYKLVPDTGGPGKFRGGLSIRKCIQALKPVLFSAHSDRHKICPWGLSKGLPGGCGKFIHRSKNKSKVIASKVSGILIEPGDTLEATTAGGGGFGHVHARDPERVQRDYRLGKISRKHAQKAYGLVLTKEGEIKRQETKILRKKIKNERRE